ncbi:hypothetical protein HDU96_009141 [Phlyctochytrium bullatum]|nr:hypothetical protein HDU96_009141 [Phlyctochytrium bullatum]
MLVPRGFPQAPRIGQGRNCGLPPRKTLPTELVAWLKTTVTEALVLNLIPRRNATYVYFVAVWLDSLDLLQLALDIFVFETSTKPNTVLSTHLFESLSGFPEHEVELRRVVNQGLLDAITTGNIGLVERFLKHPLSERSGQLEGAIVLQAAIFALKDECHDSIVRLLLSHGFDVNFQDDEGWTALMYCSPESDKIKFYLENGANVLLTIDEAGSNAMHLSAGKPTDDDAKAIISYFRSIEHEDPNAQSVLQQCLDAKSSEGFTPLMVAVYYRSPSIVKLLLESGSNLFLRDHRGRTAVDYIHRRRKKPERFQVAKLLFEQLAKLKRNRLLRLNPPADSPDLDSDDTENGYDVKVLIRALAATDEELLEVFEEFEEFREELDAVRSDGVDGPLPDCHYTSDFFDESSDDEEGNVSSESDN